MRGNSLVRELVINAISIVLLTLLVFKGLFLGLPALFFVTIAKIYRLGQAIKGRSLIKSRLAYLVLHLSLLVLTFKVMGMDTDNAKAHVEHLVSAVNAYKESRGEYPARLTDLVPETIEALPQKKQIWVISYSIYYGKADDGKHYIGFKQSIPEWGSVYIFEENRWRDRHELEVQQNYSGLIGGTGKKFS